MAKKRQPRKNPGTKSGKEIPLELAGWVALGKSSRWIAEQSGVTHDTVGGWLQNPELQARITKIKAEADREALNGLQSLKAVAIQAIGGVLTGDTCKECGRSKALDRDILRSAELVLDRTGLPRTERQEISTGAGGLDLTDAQMEQQILEEAAAILEDRGIKELAKTIRQHAASALRTAQ